jgi:phosphatidylglycerol:prolipoprotein diacylglycerol transferase
MIPWFNLDKYLPALGPLQIHVFGILVATGILVGAHWTHKRGKELGLSPEKITSMITTTLVVGFLVAHWFDFFLYQTGKPGETEREWFIRLLNPFSGISSYGGFIGALIGLFYWCRRNRQPVMPYADGLGFGLSIGWMFGRLGCFTAHDHPGAHTDFFLAVQYPGGARHDLGLYEALWAGAMTLLFFLLKRRGKQPLGLYVTLLTLGYAPVRFVLDFLRATDTEGADPRYGGLTPAQWSSIAVLFAGIMLARWTWQKAREPAPAEEAAAPAAPRKKGKK